MAGTADLADLADLADSGKKKALPARLARR
jgi:hypothetical protein